MWRGAMELLAGEESGRRGKVVVRHGDLKAAETPIRTVSHRHCIASYAATESGSMLKCGHSGKGGDNKRLSGVEGNTVVLSGYLCMKSQVCGT